VKNTNKKILNFKFIENPLLCPILDVIMDDDIPEVVKKCLDILDDNLDIISNIELDLDDEKNNDLTPDMSLHNLYDMTEDVAESEKIKRAESKFIRRQSKNS
jgi:hypothetical protein